MGFSKVRYLFFLGTLFILMGFGLCYQKCYSCYAHNFPISLPKEITSIFGEAQLPFHKSCHDPFPNVTTDIPTVNCSFSCAKTKTKEGDYHAVLRTCMLKDLCRGDCYSCEGNLCNGSSQLIPYLTVFGVISYLLRNII